MLTPDQQSMKPEEVDLQRLAGATSEFITYAVVTPPELSGLNDLRKLDVSLEQSEVRAFRILSQHRI